MPDLKLHFALLTGLALAACSSSASTGIAPVTCPSDSTLTYANFGQAFVSDNCASCHTTQERPHLTTQAEIAAASSQILDEAVYTDSMPEGASMANAERELLGEWLACGAP